MTALTGTRRLVRLALRRDRIILPVWIAAIAGLAWAMVASYKSTLPTEADRVAAVMFGASNPMARVFDGPASGTDVGAMALVEGWKVLAILGALMSAQVVVRHTRADEELGRAELLGSAVVGRHARLSAALAVAAGANVVLGLTVAVAIAAPNDLAWTGAFAAGMATTGIGWVFAGVAAIGAQVFSTARGANAVAGGVLGVAFLVRAVGDLMGDTTDGGLVVRSAWPSWLSPYGWGQQVRPFSEDNWWIGGLFVALALALVVVAFALTENRDLGAGMVQQRPGPARAARGLLSPFGLAWRLQRGILLVWVVGLGAFGAVFGSIGDEVEGFIADNDSVRDMFALLSPGADVVQIYYTFVMAIIGIAAGGYAVQALLRMRAEEMSGRVEPLLATAVGRHRWLGSHVLIAGLGTIGVLGVAGLSGGVVYGAMTGRWADGIGDLSAAAAVQMPAALALAGFVVAVFGFLPRWAGPITWFALATALVMGQLGALFDLPQWLLNVSPFTHVPRVPAEAFTTTPVVWLTVVAVGLGALGFAAFRHRDLAIGA